MANTETVRDFYGRIIGYIETKDNGDKTVRDFYKRILGYYKKSINATTDFHGRIIAKGDVSSGLLYKQKTK